MEKKIRKSLQREKRMLNYISCLFFPIKIYLFFVGILENINKQRWENGHSTLPCILFWHTHTHTHTQTHTHIHTPMHIDIYMQTKIYRFLSNNLQFCFIISCKHFSISVYIMLHHIYWLHSFSLYVVLVVLEKMIIDFLWLDI